MSGQAGFNYEGDFHHIEVKKRSNKNEHEEYILYNTKKRI